MENLSSNLNIHIIYLDNNIVLTKKNYSCWRQIQDEYPTYKTSLGPWSIEDIIDFFEDDFGKDESQWPFERKIIKKFFSSDEIIIQENSTYV
jgi:hypothetical protein